MSGNWKNIVNNQSSSSMIFGLILYMAALIVGWYTGVLVIAIAVIGCHFYLSIEEVQTNEWGALLFLSSAFKKLENAPVFAFWPFFSVKREPRTVFQVIVGTPLTNKEGKPIELPAEEGASVLREPEPFRVTFPAIENLPLTTDLSLSQLPKDSYYPPNMKFPEVTSAMMQRFKGHPLHGDITCDPQMVFWFDIKDFLDYLKVVPDIQTLSHNITGIAKATLQECAGKMTIGMLIAYNELVCRRITYRIEQLIGELHAQRGLSRPNVYWGVNFRGIQISSMGLPRTINESMRTARAASYSKDAIITGSEGEKQKRINEGAGAANALQALREAEAAGAQAFAGVANTDGGMLVLRLDALTRSIKDGTVTVLPIGGLAELGSLLTVGQTLLGSKKPTPLNKP